MKIDHEKVSLMQTEVWRMKDKVYQDTKSMGCKAFFRYIADKSQKLLKQKHIYGAGRAGL